MNTADSSYILPSSGELNTFFFLFPALPAPAAKLRQSCYFNKQLLRLVAVLKYFYSDKKNCCLNFRSLTHV